MKPEEYFKIQMEFELLKGGIYDTEIRNLINNNKEVSKKYEEDFNIIERVSEHSFKRNKQPDIKYIRIWWFKNYKHPELFGD